jgi:hypothetical protein
MAYVTNGLAFSAHPKAGETCMKSEDDSPGKLNGTGNALNCVAASEPEPRVTSVAAGLPMEDVNELESA